jgi:hypothetical protein
MPAAVGALAAPERFLTMFRDYIARLRRLFGLDPKATAFDPEREWHAARLQEVIAAVAPLFPASEPFIVDGRYSWLTHPETGAMLPISIVFLERALCIQVHPRGFGAGSGRTLEQETAIAQRLRHICQRTGAGLVEVLAEAEVTAETIRQQLIAAGVEFHDVVDDARA